MNLIEALKQANGREVEVVGCEVTTRSAIDQYGQLRYTHPDNSKRGDRFVFDVGDLSNDYIVVEPISAIKMKLTQLACEYVRTSGRAAAMNTIQHANELRDLLIKVRNETIDEIQDLWFKPDGKTTYTGQIENLKVQP